MDQGIFGCGAGASRLCLRFYLKPLGRWSCNTENYKRWQRWSVGPRGHNRTVATSLRRGSRAPGEVGILLQAFLKENLFSPDLIHATVGHAERARALSTPVGRGRKHDNLKAASQAEPDPDFGVKPFQVPDLIAEMKPALTPAKTIVSFAASVKTRSIEEGADMEMSVVRAMPNTPSASGAGAAALCRGRFVSNATMELAQRIFETVGRTVVVDEKHMDAVTGLSGSGPAYVYIIIEALAEAGVEVGLPRETATQLAAQTAYGAAKMVLETGYHPALLKDAVTTPAGCTIDGILELEEGGLRVTLIKAVMRATERARELASG